MSTVLMAQGDRVRSAEIATTIYVNEVPRFVEDELPRLYGHIYASLPYIRVFGGADQLSTYVARRGATPMAILLFCLGRRSIVVLNQTMQLDPIELQRFADCVFNQFPAVGVINFMAVQTDFSNFAYPNQRGHAKENIFVALPSTAHDYTASLGKSTRRNLKRYLARLEQSFPTVRIQSHEKSEIDEQVIRELIRLSEVRITGKRLNFRIDNEYARRIIALAKVCGVVNTIWVDGRLCVGIISYRIGTDQYAEVIAHDETYNDYSPGMLCYYLAICDSIAKGVKTFHMGGGRFDYKVWLGGIQQNMEQVEIYRSYAAMVLNCDWVMRTSLKARTLQLKTWLRSHEDNLAVRLLLESRWIMRKMIKGG